MIYILSCSIRNMVRIRHVMLPTIVAEHSSSEMDDICVTHVNNNSIRRRYTLIYVLAFLLRNKYILIA